MTASGEQQNARAAHAVFFVARCLSNRKSIIEEAKFKPEG
jgi:hypothetical protein